MNVAGLDLLALFLDKRVVARKEWEKRAREKGITLENNQKDTPAEGEELLSYIFNQYLSRRV